MWTIKQIHDALRAEGFSREGGHHDWYKEDSMYIQDGAIRRVLNAHCKTPEDLPLFLADDKRGQRSFGMETWHGSVKPVLCRLLWSGG